MSIGVLQMQAATKVFSGYAAVKGFDLQVSEGELRCLLGPNGAGKSTCMDLITGRQRLTSGRIVFYDRDITAMAEQDIARLGIGRKFQVPAVFKALTVQENFEVAALRRKDPFANMVGAGRPVSRRRHDEVVAMVGLQDRRKVPAGLLSHGETQWLEIGMVLINAPRLLLMDEPTAGMTEQETEKTSRIFNALKGDHTLIVVEHDMSFVREIADLVTVMHMGQLLAQGTIAEIERNPRVREVYLGTEGGH